MPRTLSRVRSRSCEAHVWPLASAGMFARSSVCIALIAAAGVAALVIGTAAVDDPAMLFVRHLGHCAFTG